MVVEKKRCLYLRDYTTKEVERNILSNPFKRFEDMNFMKKSRDVGYLEISRYIWRKLSKEDVDWIVGHSDEKLEAYFG